MNVLVIVYIPRIYHVRLRISHGAPVLFSHLLKRKAVYTTQKAIQFLIFPPMILTTAYLHLFLTIQVSLQHRHISQLNQQHHQVLFVLSYSYTGIITAHNIALTIK